MLGAWHWALKRLLDRITIPIVYLRSKVCVCEMRNSKVNTSYNHWPSQSSTTSTCSQNSKCSQIQPRSVKQLSLKLGVCGLPHILLPCWNYSPFFNMHLMRPDDDSPRSLYWVSPVGLRHRVGWDCIWTHQSKLECSTSWNKKVQN